MKSKELYSNGKLLLTAEYAILDGAYGLALPTTYGQSLTVTEQSKSRVNWRSFDHAGSVWFEADFDLNTFRSTGSSSTQKADATAGTLGKILFEAQKLNPSFLNDGKGYRVETHLDFPQDWGLGSSSTLINNIAQWAQIDAYSLLWNSFSGSGYDIACAKHDAPILYRLKNDRPEVKEVVFDPPFKNELYFIHLNQKQNSREGIARYRSRNFVKTELVKTVSDLTIALLSCTEMAEFENLMTRHELLIGKTLDLPMVKERLFPDFPGAIKSLGAWGGDFVLAAGNSDTPNYFKKKGYDDVVPYSKMIL
ncbi:GHMP kinase [Aggregatimonas sangjinii]|uniref:GHMP kinase n=1 Tax=Aggregatimonas sangjinii TaxID=2583587 RepID=A0A5B7SJW1_9FLAO|nr:GYDIA family GHMP kinase [Aggregatimonas sangjinii]QCW98716.1 GHMP kinase [Aggregatimonas sangjinii]